MKQLTPEQRKDFLAAISTVLTEYGLNSKSLILMTIYENCPNMIEYVSQSDGKNPLHPIVHGVIADIFKDLQNTAPYPPLHSN